MKIDVLTLFPEMFMGILNESILKRAIEQKKVDINIYNIRDYAKNSHKKVDDYGYGGGTGMVLMPQPIYDALEALKTKETLVVMMTPQGDTYTQKKAYEFLNYSHIILLCGHYEGFDERIRSFVDVELSIGDYILTGGELPSMVVIDSITRLIDGVIKEESHVNDSFNNDLLDYPVYTKPAIFNNMEVPEVLLSGHHENIHKWRLEQSVQRTKERRPDLLEES